MSGSGDFGPSSFTNAVMIDADAGVRVVARMGNIINGSVEMTIPLQVHKIILLCDVFHESAANFQ